MSSRGREILTGVELGTASVKVVVGEVRPDGTITVLGTGSAPSLRKVMKGIVVDRIGLQDQLEEAVRAAEENAGEEIQNVFLAVTGGHIKTTNCVGSRMIQTPDRVVTEDDVVEASRNARAWPQPPDKTAVHFIDRRYILDGRREVASPLGQAASKLDAEVHVVYGDSMVLQTSSQLVSEVLGEGLADIAFSPIADVYAAVSADDRARGVLVIDIGAGVTEYALVQGAGCFHSGQLTVGCEHIANDLAEAFRLPVQRARKLLIQLDHFGSARMRADGRKRWVQIETVGRNVRKIPASSIEKVIDLRLHELFRVIRKDLEAQDVLHRAGGGIRLCGGGARIPDISELAREVFRLPASIAELQDVSGEKDILDDPGFVTPIGLIRFGHFSIEIGRAAPAPARIFGQELRRAWEMIKRAFRL